VSPTEAAPPPIGKLPREATPIDVLPLAEIEEVDPEDLARRGIAVVNKLWSDLQDLSAHRGAVLQAIIDETAGDSDSRRRVALEEIAHLPNLATVAKTLAAAGKILKETRELEVAKPARSGVRGRGKPPDRVAPTTGRFGVAAPPKLVVNNDGG
jgi:hypothetical protein